MGWEKFCKCQKKLFGNLKSIANAKHIPRYAGIIRTTSTPTDCPKAYSPLRGDNPLYDWWNINQVKYSPLRGDNPGERYIAQIKIQYSPLCGDNPREAEYAASAWLYSPRSGDEFGKN